MSATDPQTSASADSDIVQMNQSLLETRRDFEDQLNELSLEELEREVKGRLEDLQRMMKRTLYQSRPIDLEQLSGPRPDNEEGEQHKEAMRNLTNEFKEIMGTLEKAPRQVEDAKPDDIN